MDPVSFAVGLAGTAGTVGALHYYLNHKSTVEELEWCHKELSIIIAFFRVDPFILRTVDKSQKLLLVDWFFRLRIFVQNTSISIRKDRRRDQWQSLRFNKDVARLSEQLMAIKDDIAICIRTRRDLLVDILILDWLSKLQIFVQNLSISIRKDRRRYQWQSLRFKNGVARLSEQLRAFNSIALYTQARRDPLVDNVLASRQPRAYPITSTGSLSPTPLHPSLEELHFSSEDWKAYAKQLTRLHQLANAQVNQGVEPSLLTPDLGLNCLLSERPWLQDAETSLRSQFKTSPQKREYSWIKDQALRIRPCYILIFLGSLTIFGSLTPALLRSIDDGDVSGGFAVAQYVLGVGVFVIGCIVAIHSRTCTCWSSTNIGSGREEDTRGSSVELERIGYSSSRDLDHLS